MRRYSYTTLCLLMKFGVQIRNWWGFLHWFPVKSTKWCNANVVKVGKVLAGHTLMQRVDQNNTHDCSISSFLLAWKVKSEAEKPLSVCVGSGVPASSGRWPSYQLSRTAATASPSTLHLLSEYLSGHRHVAALPLLSFHLLTARFFLATFTRPFLLFLFLNPSPGCPHLHPKAE